MPWSVIAPDHHPLASNGQRMVYDIVVPRGRRTPEAAAHRKRAGYHSQVLLVGTDWGTGEVTKIRLGAVLHDRSSLTTNWWAMGYYPGFLDPNDVPRELIRSENPVESARGFATRTYAIEHMLRRTGWWSND